MNTYGFQPTVNALQVLQAALQAIPLSAVGVTADNTNTTADSTTQTADNAGLAFQKVAMFDMSNLVVALQELITYANRVCLIVHDNERFTNEKKGRQLFTRQTRQVSLLMADRHFANRQKALFGDKGTPGVLALKDAVLGEIVGLLEPGVYVQPVHGEQMVLEQKIRETLQGRVAFMLVVELVGGNIITDLGVQPIP